MAGAIEFREIATLEEAMEVARLRNQCCEFFTNDRREITPEQQAAWFETRYRVQDPQTFHVWLARDGAGDACGYCAARLEDGAAYVTECVGRAHRGRGIGRQMLEHMRLWALGRGAALVADILDSNAASIRLHERFGFAPHSRVSPTVSRYHLAHVG